MNSKNLTHFVNYRRRSPGLFRGWAFVSLALGQISLGSAQGTSFQPTGSMLAARSGHTATLLPDGKVLVAGGWGSGWIALSSAELYDPVTGTWSPTGPMAVGRANPTATLLRNGKVLVAGGANNGGARFASAELYDPGTGTWAVTAGMTVPRDCHKATLLQDGSVLVADGLISIYAATEVAEIYDPVGGTWSDPLWLSTGRGFHTATLLPNGRVLIAGGMPAAVEGASLFTTELFDPATASGTVSGEMVDARALHTATLLQDGKVLLAGGGLSSYAFGPNESALPTAELYDWRTGTSASTARMGIPRMCHTANLLRNAKVLVTGGSPILGIVISSAEIYDPASRTWSEEGTMGANRQFHTATLLTNGQVLVVGGDNGTASLSSAELYTNSTTPLQTLLAATAAASAITPASATLNGAIFPNHQNTGAWFEYGTTTDYGRTTAVTRVDASNGFPVAVSTQISALLDGASYHFRLVATNGAGTSSGTDLTFTATEVPLIVNGDFETGNFTGWSHAGFPWANSVSTNPLGVHSGDYGAVLGPPGELGYLSQSLPTTPGQFYLISFWLDCAGGVPNEFLVKWDGASLFHDVNFAPTGWTNVQLRAVATRSGTILRFGFRNDPVYFGLDDVSLVTISAPELFPGATSVLNGNIRLTWSSIAGLNYQLQYRTGLNLANWLDLGPRVTATDVTTTVLDPIGPDPQRFYRVVLLP